MEDSVTYLLLLIGFVLLIKGADYFVDGASGIAKHFRIPSLLIGLTIVAFGTSAPEAAVSIGAAIKGNTGIALGNVLGSNIFNITFIIGLSAILFPLTVERQTIRKEIPLTLLAGLSLAVLSLDNIFGENQAAFISRGDGIILLLLFCVFLYYIFEVAKSSREVDASIEEVKIQPLRKCALYTLGGMVAIIFGGDLVVKSSIEIAKQFGLSDTLIGLTIVAVGTSLPELITSAVASMKKQTDIAVGNIIGSNIFNILFVLGASAVVKPLVVDTSLTIELILNIVLTLVLFQFSRSGRKIVKAEGIILCVLYVAYMIFLVMTKA